MKLISSRQISFEEGRITLLKQPVEMIPANYFVGLTRYFMQKQKTDKNAISELYLIGWFVAYVYMGVFEEVYNLKSFTDRYRLGMDVVTMAGFGDYKTIKWEKGKLSYVYSLDNPIPKYFYPSKEPVDHILRGITAGGGLIVHHNLVHCTEEECAAVTGNNKCILINATEEKYDEMRRVDLLYRQIDLDFIVPRQRECIRNIDRYKRGEFDPWECLFS